jgi:hypothetical protein
MTTFNINKTFSATYTISKAPKGWVAKGRIWRGNTATKITFEVTGTTRQNADTKARAKAREICPAEE